MVGLLEEVLAAHGGKERWSSYRRCSTKMVSGGELIRRKATESLDPLQVRISLHEQYTSIETVPASGKFSSFRHERVAVETAAGKVLAEKINPRETFEGHDLDTPWDLLDRVYFSGYAMWSYLNAPFFFTFPGVLVEECDPLSEGGETWRGLKLTFPPNLAAHSKVQRFYFDNQFLLRRQDYTVDVAGGHNIANYALDTQWFDGLAVATKRRAYLCTEDYAVLRDRLLVWLDMSDIAFD